MEELSGKFVHALDQKNRLFIPSKFREILGEQFVASIPLNGDKCIMVYSEPEWDRFMQAVESKYEGYKLVSFNRLIGAKLEHVTPDKQGRIVLRQDFCEFASLAQEAVVTGARNHVEIWNRETWDAMYAQESERFMDPDLPY